MITIILKEERNMNDEIARQTIAGTALLAGIIGWLPIILAAPAAVYYIILVMEKLTGKPASEWFKKE